VYDNDEDFTIHPEYSNLDSLKILKCDFHMHTTFSDGTVTPKERIDEAVNEGLDAIAITDHLWKSPITDSIHFKENAAWIIGEPYANQKNIILIHGTELTEMMPPGHFNAIFIKDASSLVKSTFTEALEEVKKQGGISIWNHPGWKFQQPDGNVRVYNIHKEIMQKKLIQGIEFANAYECYPQVLSIANEYGLFVSGNSDLHFPASKNFIGSHRPITLVMARARTSEAIKEALLNGYTLVYFNDIFAAKEDIARKFFSHFVSFNVKSKKNDLNDIYIFNSSDYSFHLVKTEGKVIDTLSLTSHSINKIANKGNIKDISFVVSNIFIDENKNLSVALN
jgi:histidinol phosphatase-like PHP family hydrolase